MLLWISGKTPFVRIHFKNRTRDSFLVFFFRQCSMFWWFFQGIWLHVRIYYKHQISLWRNFNERGFTVDITCYFSYCHDKGGCQLTLLVWNCHSWCAQLFKSFGCRTGEVGVGLTHHICKNKRTSYMQALKMEQKIFNGLSPPPFNLLPTLMSHEI